LDEVDARFDVQRERERAKDYRTAIICWAIFTSGGVKKRGGTSWTPSDFMPSAPMSDEAREKVNAARAAVLSAAARGRAKRSLAKAGKLSTS